MAFLFEIRDKTVFPTAEALMISPYKDVWERDKSKAKEKALKEFAYIEFMMSKKSSNPFGGYDDVVRAEKIMNDIIKDKKWKPDQLVVEAMHKLEMFQTEASANFSFLVSAKKGASKVKDFFEDVDLKERNEKTGNPIYKASDITRALNDTEKIVMNLQALTKRVEQELYEATKTKSDKVISPFANPGSLS